MIEPVERADDPRIREYRHTGNPAWLRSQGLFVAEGRLVLKRLLDSGRFPVRSILLTPPALQSFGASIDTPAPIFVASPDLLREITGFDFHRGCLALAHRPSEDPIAGRFADAELLLAIEGVGNPDNIGGLFRAAAAFGVDGVLLDPASADPFYRKAVRTSMGAVLTVPFERAAMWPAALEPFKGSGFRILALTPRVDARPLADVLPLPSGGLIVLVGAEGPGLSEAALATADMMCRIPISADVDSLNVVVAAAIALSRVR